MISGGQQYQREHRGAVLRAVHPYNIHWVICSNPTPNLFDKVLKQDSLPILLHSHMTS